MRSDVRCSNYWPCDWDWRIPWDISASPSQWHCCRPDPDTTTNTTSLTCDALTPPLPSPHTYMYVFFRDAPTRKIHNAIDKLSQASATDSKALFTRYINTTCLYVNKSTWSEVPNPVDNLPFYGLQQQPSWNRTMLPDEWTKPAQHCRMSVRNPHNAARWVNETIRPKDLPLAAVCSCRISR